jgi:hypothetical protein
MGYGSLMLKHVLARLKGTEATAFMLTCDETNVASQKTIEKHGGILDAKIEFEGTLTRRMHSDFWIQPGTQPSRSLLSGGGQFLPPRCAIFTQQTDHFLF